MRHLNPFSGRGEVVCPFCFRAIDTRKPMNQIWFNHKISLIKVHLGQLGHCLLVSRIVQYVRSGGVNLKSGYRIVSFTAPPWQSGRVGGVPVQPKAVGKLGLSLASDGVLQ